MSNPLDAILNQYKESGSNVNFQAKTYDLANYFSTYLPEGVTEGTKVVRILPAAEGDATPFVEMFAHKYKLDGQWKTFPCLDKEEGKPCPFCETRNALRAEGTEESKELAKKFNVRKFYIVKLIDRDKEHEGVKFWRFADNWQKTGTFDKIVGIYKAVKHDIADATTGRDLQINIARNSNGSPVVQSIIQLDKSELSEDADLSKKWLADARTWRDGIYATKSYEYLEIVVRGGVPAWDKAKEGWVDKDALTEDDDSKTSTNDLESELTMGMGSSNNKLTTEETTTPETATVSEPATSSANDTEDDLPF